jgi:hypothetical protein
MLVFMTWSGCKRSSGWMIRRAPRCLRDLARVNEHVPGPVLMDETIVFQIGPMLRNCSRCRFHWARSPTLFVGDAQFRVQVLEVLLGAGTWQHVSFDAIHQTDAGVLQFSFGPFPVKLEFLQVNLWLQCEQVTQVRGVARDARNGQAAVSFCQDLCRNIPFSYGRPARPSSPFSQCAGLLYKRPLT